VHGHGLDLGHREDLQRCHVLTGHGVGVARVLEIVDLVLVPEAVPVAVVVRDAPQRRLVPSRLQVVLPVGVERVAVARGLRLDEPVVRVLDEVAVVARVLRRAADVAATPVVRERAAPVARLAVVEPRAQGVRVDGDEVVGVHVALVTLVRPGRYLVLAVVRRARGREPERGHGRQHPDGQHDLSTFHLSLLLCSTVRMSGFSPPSRSRSSRCVRCCRSRIRPGPCAPRPGSRPARDPGSP